MSDDSFNVIRQKADGLWYWGNLSASEWWYKNDPYPDELFTHGPFSTADLAYENADKIMPDVEYGFEEDRPLPLQNYEEPGDKALKALKELLPLVESYQDAGPAGEGWQSDRLVSAIQRAREAITQGRAAREH